METSIADLIADGLALPTDLIGYAVGRRLTERFADGAVIEVSDSTFDLDEFVEGGHCTAVLRPDVFSEVILSFRGLGRGLDEDAVNAWHTVTWQGRTIEVVVVSWVVRYSLEKHYWIVAESEDIAREFYRQVCEWASEVRGEVLVFDDGCWSKDEMLYRAIRTATFENLVLPPALKQEIRDDFEQFFASREVYERYRIPWKRGVLLIGPPGNGKTHTVKALLNWLDVPCLYVKTFRSKYRTEQANIRSVFQRARQTVPCILVLEDLDSLITDQNRSFFLNELDGFAANTGIVVLATTNHPERLDPALVNRPSRFDRKYHFELPADAERHAYIAAWNAALEPEIRLAESAIAYTVGATVGFSYAYLKELFLSALMRWISHPGKASMDAVFAEQCDMLRAQMHAMDDAIPPLPTSDGEDDDDLE